MFWKLLPNILTLLRLAAGLLFPVVAPFWWLPLILFAGISDLIDGWLCRRWHGSTKFGQLVDPVADKVFVLSALYSLWQHEWLTLWGILWLALRDITVVVLTLIAAASTRLTTKDLRPRWSGKIATAAQFIALTIIAWQQQPAEYAVLWCGLVSFVAAVDYIQISWRVYHLRSSSR